MCFKIVSLARFVEFVMIGYFSLVAHEHIFSVN